MSSLFLYLSAFASTIMTLGFLLMIFFLYKFRAPENRQLFYYALFGSSASAMFLPLFYGSVGTLLKWPQAALVYSNSWMGFVGGIGLYFLVIAYINLTQRFGQ